MYMTIYETACSFEGKDRDDLNLHKSLDWCAETVEQEIQRSDILEEAKTVTSISCNQMLRKMRENPYWTEPEDDMKPGDVFFFNWGHDYDPEGDLDHVGIVVEVYDNYIVTMEGNSEGRENWRKVKRVTHNRCNLNFNCAYPDFYMRYTGPIDETPKTEEPAVVEEKTTCYNIKINGILDKTIIDKISELVPGLTVDIEIIEETKKTVKDIAKEVLNGDWGNGEDRKTRLVAAGYDYDEVQKEVNNLL